MPENGVPGGLVTDLYELTMAQGYWRSGLSAMEAAFHQSFRTHPFAGGFTVACGLEQAAEWLRSLRFDDEAIEYLSSLRRSDGSPLFEPGFLGHLADFEFTCDVDAVPEGTVVFPNEPLVRVSGPILQCQLVETALLNIVNFQSLVATKAARVVQAAEGDPVIEFGLRRAQGLDGGLSASRAAYVGGCSATSNVLAGQRHGIPVKGTNAHSWVMAFDTEIEAFRAYAEAFPDDTVLIVDTYETLEGVRNAARVGVELRGRGHRLAGVRIDSGDLAWLSARAREILDEAGLHDAVIVASNELDEHLVASLKDQGAPIGMWGVGTKLATGHPDGSLGGVYKLSAVRRPGGEWEPRIKVSNQTAKVTTPGVLCVRRYLRDDGGFAGDMIHDEARRPHGAATMIDPSDPTRHKSFPAGQPFVEILEPVFRSGRMIDGMPSLEQARARAAEQIASLDPTQRRFLNPHTYPVGLEESVHDVRMRMILEEREHPGETPRSAREEA